MSENPLKKFMRTEKVFVKLPSNFIWYDNSIVEKTASNEVGVQPMTATDEVALNSPDALLNGEGLKSVVESCVPSVKNARLLTSPDIDVLFLAIRKVSYGDKINFKRECPECKHENKFQTSCQYLLDNVQLLEPPYTVEFKDGLKVNVKPYSFDTNTKLALHALETRKLLEQYNKTLNDDELSKLSKYSKTFQNIAKLSVEILMDGIESVEFMNDDNTLFKIPNNEENFNNISEWVSNINTKQVDAIRNKIKEVNEIGINKYMEVTCENCNHNWTTEVDYNPVNFFEGS